MGDLVELRQNIVPILEANGVDLVLMGHSHVYERSYLLDGHYGLSSTLTSSMKIDGGNGREDGTGAYRKNDEGRGVVYTIAGNAGQALGGSLNHPAHVVSLNELGTLVIDVSNNRLDVKSLNASGAVNDYYTLLKPQPFPSAPLDLVALPSGSNDISLAWTPGSKNQLGYSVERSLDGLNFAEQLLAPASATNALDAGLVLGTTYYYRVRATNAVGTSGYSTIASATIVAPTSAPRAPAVLAARSDNGVEFYRSQMILNWQDRSTNEAAFQIERSLDGSTFVAAATVGANVTHYVDRHLASGTPYYYRIRAVNSLGVSTPTAPSGDTTHPQSQVAVAGASATFHAGAEGAPLVGYQWRFKGTAIPSATNEALVLNGVQSTNEGDYTVSLADASGRHESNPAYLFVLSPPRIVAQPQDLSNIAGTTASLSVIAEGNDPLTYRWRKNGVPLVGVGNPTLAFASVQVSDAAGYDVIVANDFGSATSRVARLNVYVVPVLPAIPETFAEVLTPLTISNTAIDPNVPPRQLTYSLVPGGPTNAHLNSVNGVFRWTPTRAQAPSTNQFTVRFIDPSFPQLSNSTSFIVRVKDYVEATIGSTTVLAGETTNTVPVDFFTSAPLLTLDYVLRFNGLRLTNLVIEPLAPGIANVSLLQSDANTASATATLSFAATGGNTLQGTQRLARVRFTAVTNQISAFVPLDIDSMNVTMSPSLAPTLVATDGRIAVIVAQPLLDAHFTAAGARELGLYGRRNTTYIVQYSTNLANITNWIQRGNALPMGANLYRTVPVGNIPNTNLPAVFRARTQ